MGLISAIVYWLRGRKILDIQRKKQWLDYYKRTIEDNLNEAEKERDYENIKRYKKITGRIDNDFLSLRMILLKELGYYNNRLFILKTYKKSIPSVLMINRAKIQKMLKEYE